MKSYNTAYYLLTVLLIMGAFASMAQNNYGMMILTGVSIAFSLIFLIQFIAQLRVKRDWKDERLEFLALFILSVIFTLRTLQIYFPFIEWLFAAAGIGLALIYLHKMIGYRNQISSHNRGLSLIVGIAYLSIILFSVAMVLFALTPRISRIMGLTALILAIGFLISGLMKAQTSVEGEDTAPFPTIAGFKDRFYLLLSLFLIFSLYIGFTGSGVLPKLYSDNYPQTYYELVNQAETGKEKPVNGQYKYELFKKQYDLVVKRNITPEKK